MPRPAGQAAEASRRTGVYNGQQTWPACALPGAATRVVSCSPDNCLLTRDDRGLDSTITAGPRGTYRISAPVSQPLLAESGQMRGHTRLTVLGAGSEIRGTP